MAGRGASAPPALKVLSGVNPLLLCHRLAAFLLSCAWVLGGDGFLRVSRKVGRVV